MKLTNRALAQFKQMVEEVEIFNRASVFLRYRAVAALVCKWM